MNKFRIEQDCLGKLKIPAYALWGIHTARAMENFPLTNRPITPSLIAAFATVKLAALQTNICLGYISSEKGRAIEQACIEMQAGKLNQEIKVDVMQGGAGTSTNMNVNEVLTNRALQILGRKLGDYSFIHPIEHLNLHQSTNDCYPTALKIAVLQKLKILEKALILLLKQFQNKEQEFAHIVKIARTQMQDAVLTTMGRSFSAYAEAIGRDRWRISKCEERLRVINLGGTAIGTGLTAPRKYIFQVTNTIRQLTELPLARSENLIDATQNNDEFVEVSGILKASASNLFKISNDLRFLSSGPTAGIGELILPPRQAGSSVMPNKINPVIPEAVIQASIKIMANDQALTQACSMGNLELNPFMPLIADTIIENINLLTNASNILAKYCIAEIKTNQQQCQKQVATSTATITAIVDKIGYQQATNIAKQAEQKNQTIPEILIENKIMTKEKFQQAISAEAVTRLGS